jgi:outer membrane protein
MKNIGRHTFFVCLLALSWPAVCHADDADEWFIRAGALGALYHAGASIATPSGRIPGASANVSDNATAIVEVGYDPSPDTYLMLMGGVPPRPKLSGSGTIASIGELGAVNYGPAILTAGYRLPAIGSLQPYVGAGVAYAIIVNNHDAAVSNLVVQNNFGFAIQAGAEYALNEQWQLFVDVKELWLSVKADGLLGGSVPVDAHVRLDPTLISIGVKYRL